ncbi:hypothetical protein [Occultella gossypii]|uniref:Carboxymuconolactone decarboxylase family protein n=1 Tax=Occultella gossypii TaxID=2800820 RepID=A0ABS7SGL0_9MICO|nr:hypothetical protein [Occultella gossypii]MBZ2199048.1 hypothetical protein [Occultella gossypii]
MDAIEKHRRHAEAVRSAATGSAGVTEAALRAAVLARAAGGAPLGQPYDALARQIGEAAYRVTDAQVEEVRVAEGSDKRAFEIIMAASIGAGLAQWDAAIGAIEGTGDATS